MKTSLVLLAMAAVIQAGVVTGTVRGENGQGVAGAKVAIPALNIEVTADNSGSYQLKNVPNGTYDVLFGADNYQTGYLRDVTFEGTAIGDAEIRQYKMDFSVVGSSASQKINFVIPDRAGSTPVRLKLVDMRGRVLFHYEENGISSGLHSVALPTHLAKGVYAVQLTINNESISRKMITY